MEDKKVLSAAYTPFKTFLSSLDHLKSHGIPNSIDRSFFQSQSGTMQGQIIGAFRFLGLIDENGAPSEKMVALVNSSEEERKTQLAGILKQAYTNLFEADLEKITPAQFDALFSTEIYGVSGDTKNKAKSFFFFALKNSGIKHSKLLTKITRVRNKGGAKKVSANKEKLNAETNQGNGNDSNGKKDSSVNSDVIRTPIPLGLGRTAYVELPKDWQQNDLRKLIGILKLSLGNGEGDSE